MNGARTHLPERLAVALGGLATLAATLAVHRVGDGRAWYAPPWMTATAVATDLVGPGVVTALALLLLQRTGHRGLAQAGAIAWTLASGITAALGGTVWLFLVSSPLDEPGALLPVVVAAGNGLVVGAPLLLARRDSRPPLRARPGTRRALALGIGTAAGLLLWSITQDDSGIVDDQRCLLLVIGVTVAAAVTGAVTGGLPGRRPDGDTLAWLGAVYLAWRLVVLIGGRADEIGTWRDDAVRVAVVLAAVLASLAVSRALPTWRDLSRRGPVLWGYSGPDPLPPAVQAVPGQAEATPRPSSRSLAAATALTVAAVGVVAWQAHERSPGTTRETLAAARAAAASFDPAGLADGATDPTGTACGDGLWTWCGTTSRAPETAATSAAQEMARLGWTLGRVTCASADPDPGSGLSGHSGAPLTTTRWTQVCTASARHGDVTVAVATGSTLTWMGEAGYPAVDQGRTAVMAGAFATHDDPIADADWSSRSATPLGAPDGGSWATRIAPPHWTATLTCSTPDTPEGKAPPLRRRGCPAHTNAHVLLRHDPAAGPAPENASTFADLGFGLRRAGFRVLVAGCAPAGNCQAIAEQWYGAGRTQHELVIGRQRSDGSILIVAGS